MVKEKKTLLIVVSIIFIITLAAIIIWRLVFMVDYYTFYLSSGDIYFGKLDWFSCYTIRDPYYIGFAGEDGQVSIERFQEAFWGPQNKLKLNPNNVIWISKLAPDSPVIEYINSY